MGVERQCSTVFGLEVGQEAVPCRDQRRISATEADM